MWMALAYSMPLRRYLAPMAPDALHALKNNVSEYTLSNTCERRREAVFVHE